MPAWLLSPLVLKTLAVAGLLLLLYGMKEGYDAKHEEIGAARVQAKWDADKAARLKAFTDMTTKWVVASQDAEKAIKERDDARAQRFNDAKAKASALPTHIASLPVPYQSVVVLESAIDAASARSPAEPSKASTSPPADSTVGAITQWGVAMTEWADMCMTRVQGWADFYDSLRKSQPKGNP